MARMKQLKRSRGDLYPPLASTPPFDFSTAGRESDDTNSARTSTVSARLSNPNPDVLARVAGRANPARRGNDQVMPRDLIARRRRAVLLDRDVGTSMATRSVHAQSVHASLPDVELQYCLDCVRYHTHIYCDGTQEYKSKPLCSFHARNPDPTHAAQHYRPIRRYLDLRFQNTGAISSRADTPPSFFHRTKSGHDKRQPKVNFFNVSANLIAPTDGGVESIDDEDEDGVEDEEDQEDQEDNGDDNDDDEEDESDE